MREPLITIITPTYKRDTLLRRRALPSVFNQTYKNWEWIVVHDGLDTELIEILNSYDDKRIRPYAIPRKEPHHNYNSEKAWFLSGTYPANFALDKVKGDWIARLDDDDVWSKDHLEKLLEFALKGNYDLVSSQYIIIKDRKGILYSGIPIKDFLKEGDCNAKIGGHSTFFYRGYLKSIKYNPNAYKRKWNRVDHADLTYQMYKIGVNFGFLEEVTMFIYTRPNEKEIGFAAVKEKIKKNGG